jgi:hypothetical protein
MLRIIPHRYPPGCCDSSEKHFSIDVSKRPTKAQREQARADQFREEVKVLRYLPGQDWNDWELDWQESQLRRSPFYTYSEKEHAVLARMRRDAMPFSEWDGYTTRELVIAAHAYRMDCSEHDQKFLEKLHRQDHSTLRRRQMSRLVGICRQVAGLLVAPFDHDRVAA